MTHLRINLKDNICEFGPWFFISLMYHIKIKETASGTTAENRRHNDAFSDNLPLLFYYMYIGVFFLLYLLSFLMKRD